MNAGPDDAGDTCAGILEVAKPISTARAHSGLRRMRTVTFGDDAEQTFRAGHDAEQIIAAAVEMPAAEADDLAGHQRDLETQHIVAGDPYLRQCTPPEFSATLPPIVQAICEEGSGA